MDINSMKYAELIGSEVLLAKPKRFVCEMLRMPDGQEIDWYYADVAESVMIVPVADDIPPRPTGTSTSFSPGRCR